MNPFNFLSVKYPSSLQMELWLMKRNDRLKGKEIATKKGITTASVSRSLKEANSRIQDLLESTARSNKLKINVISPKLGYARGFSPTLQIWVFITYSPVNGLQVWYDHDQGTCEICEELTGCRQLLIQEFKERNIDLPHHAVRPSDLSALLFSKIEGRLK